jgi:signal transduction histidine kinase
MVERLMDELASDKSQIDQTISNLEKKLALSGEALCKAEERAAAGQYALELMHEIRNPLEALGYLTYLAYEEADNPDEVRNYMRQAEEQTTTLSRMTSETLGFAKSLSSARPMDLVCLAEAALRIHRRAINAKKIHLVKDLPKELIASVHTGAMLQAISNLIDNALDALPADGTLSLRLKKRGPEVHFLIADNGHGIRAEHVHMIFQPFFTTKEEHGNGLGLSLTKKIIDRHKGTICVRSCVRPGRSGTLFKVRLPDIAS